MSKPCKCCNGSGVESTVTEDLRLAHQMRDLRITAGISGRKMARALGVKEGYISMLESGKRRFTMVLLEGYRVHCDPEKPKGYYLPARMTIGTMIFQK